MYWVTDEPYISTKRPVAEPGPYKCSIRGEEYALVVTYLVEGTEYDPEKQRVIDTIGANGYTIPDRPLVVYEKLEVWHVDDPSNRVTLKVSGFPAANDHVAVCRLTGEGSMLCMGPSLHFQEESQTNDA